MWRARWMLRMVRAARSPVPTMTTGSLHQGHRRAAWTTSTRASGTVRRLKTRASSEGDAGIERRQPQSEGKRREDQEAESGDIREPAEDFDRAEAEARIKSSLRIAENE